MDGCFGRGVVLLVSFGCEILLYWKEAMGREGEVRYGEKMNISKLEWNRWIL